ncbi:MAG: hypothetical protein WKF36_02480 [Candidatus Nitrosocosmicus sp.]
MVLDKLLQMQFKFWKETGLGILQSLLKPFIPTNGWIRVSYLLETRMLIRIGNKELECLFAAQWKNGMIPSIVFDKKAKHTFRQRISTRLKGLKTHPKIWARLG